MTRATRWGLARADTISARRRLSSKVPGLAPETSNCWVNADSVPSGRAVHREFRSNQAAQKATVTAAQERRWSVQPDRSADRHGLGGPVELRIERHLLTRRSGISTKTG